MAELEEALYAILSGEAAVSGLVGDRIYPSVIPQDVALPAIAYQRISSVREYNLTAYSHLVRPRMQLTHVAETYPVCKGVATAVRLALSGYRGVAAGVFVQAAFLERDEDEYEEGNGLFICRQDYLMWHTEV